MAFGMRGELPFVPLASSEPSFNCTFSGVASSAQLFQLDSTTRIWSGPTGRSIRLSETSGIDYFIQFGSSLAAAQSSASLMVLGAVVETFRITPDLSTSTSVWMSVLTTSTGVSFVNCTLGYGR